MGEGVGIPPLRVSKLSFVELSGNDRRIALDENTRLEVRLLILGQNLTKFQGQKPNLDL